MLAVESLTEAVAFLPLYDLDAVLLANRQLSSIASKCVEGIRVWDFDCVSITLCGELMFLLAEEAGTHKFSGSGKFANLLEIALHNSSIECLILTLSPRDVRMLPNKLALEVREMWLQARDISSADFLGDVLSRFRKVQAVHLQGCENVTDFSPLINVCRQKGVRSVINNSNGAELLAEQ